MTDRRQSQANRAPEGSAAAAGMRSPGWGGAFARPPRSLRPPAVTALPAPGPGGANAGSGRRFAGLSLSPPLLLLALVLLVFPLLAGPFWQVQVLAQAAIYGTIALSLAFLAGQGGMVSLAQTAIAGLAGYLVAILGTSSEAFSLGWPWWLTIPAAVLAATAFATFVGILANRTDGIYTIMITLAISVAFFYFCQQNYAIFNGYDGFSTIAPPPLFGVDWRAPLPFTYLCVGVAAFWFGIVLYVRRSTFGISLQATRDNARRMRALGFNVTLTRVFAFSFAGLIAATGGVLLVWHHSRISPGSIGVDVTIDMLIIAVLGGMRHPIGAFIGALIFVLLKTFAIDLVDRERFNTLIGLCFLVVVLFSPDGILGLWERMRRRLAADPLRAGRR